MVCAYGGGGVHDQAAEELHAHNGVDEEQHAHQHADIRQSLKNRHRRRINREGKGRHCWLGDVLECRTTDHLAARMI